MVAPYHTFEDSCGGTAALGPEYSVPTLAPGSDLATARCELPNELLPLVGVRSVPLSVGVVGV